MRSLQEQNDRIVTRNWLINRLVDHLKVSEDDILMMTDEKARVVKQQVVCIIHGIRVQPA